VSTKKVELKFGGSSFHIDLEEGFAKSLEPELEELFKSNSNNDIKVLLQAFIAKSYELYELKQEVQKSIHKLDKQQN
jgi:hypothetical protein